MSKQITQASEQIARTMGVLVLFAFAFSGMHLYAQAPGQGGGFQAPAAAPGGGQLLPGLVGAQPATVPPSTPSGVNTNLANPAPIIAAPGGMGKPAALQDIIPTRTGGFHLDPMVRVKDITTVEGDRFNTLTGMGLVAGLAGTGGRSEQTMRVVTNYYKRNGIPLTRADTTNMSVVVVTAKIPAFARAGEKILVDVSVLDDAASIRGGTLIQTALKGIDDEIYALAAGQIVGAGIAVQGNAASVSLNHPTVGVCEATLEREIPCSDLVRYGRMNLIVQNKSFTTATRIANAINVAFRGGLATARDKGTVEVIVPKKWVDDVTPFISMIGDLQVHPDKPAEVVINQKTGTIIAGANVKISSVVFASENIVISTSETPVASQPAPLSQGQTAILDRTQVDIFGSGGSYNVLNEGLSVGDLANALNVLGVSPNTLINIMTDLRKQGHLQAKLSIE
ncbi:MAG: flagellar basal body P-ring protein FlgI [Planctomycetota bacterium]